MFDTDNDNKLISFHILIVYSVASVCGGEGEGERGVM